VGSGSGIGVSLLGYDKSFSNQEHAILDDLNRNYIRAVAEADTAWFDAHLADDFRNTNPDGRLLGRAEFIAQIARGPGIAGLVAHDVLIRQFGDHAQQRARGGAGARPER